METFQIDFVFSPTPDFNEEDYANQLERERKRISEAKIQAMSPETEASLKATIQTFLDGVKAHKVTLNQAIIDIDVTLNIKANIAFRPVGSEMSMNSVFSYSVNNLNRSEVVLEIEQQVAFSKYQLEKIKRFLSMMLDYMSQGELLQERQATMTVTIDDNSEPSFTWKTCCLLK